MTYKMFLTTTKLFLGPLSIGERSKIKFVQLIEGLIYNDFDFLRNVLDYINDRTPFLTHSMSARDKVSKKSFVA